MPASRFITDARISICPADFGQRQRVAQGASA
jgi:hypothetical protein